MLLLGCSGTSDDNSAPAPGEAPTHAPEEPNPLPQTHAAFVELPERAYAIDGLEPDGVARVGPARLSVRYFAGQTPDLPLCVISSGGPGVTSAMMQKAFGISAETQGLLAPVCHSLFIDARNTGFSYNLRTADGDPGFPVSENNPYADAADFVMVLLSFLLQHPAVAARPMVVIGESYGGVRTSVMVDMLHTPERYASGERAIVDTAMLDSVADAEARLGVDFTQTLRHQALLQPTLLGSLQDETTGELLEQPGSVLHQLAEALGEVYDTCSGTSCQPYFNAIIEVESWGRSAYNYAEEAGWLGRKVDTAHALMETEEGASRLLGVPPGSVPLLRASDRLNAWRVESGADTPADSQWSRSALGTLNGDDRYFIAFNDVAFGAFSSSEAIELGVDWLDPTLGVLFLENCRRTHTFLTRASFDLVNYSPGLLGAMERYASVERVELKSEGAEPRPGRLTVHYEDGAVVDLRSPEYEAGHGIIGDAGPVLVADIGAWLRATLNE